jgi:hypothetical protein
MKKIIATMVMALAIITAQAQNGNGSRHSFQIDHEVFRITATIFFVYLLMNFLLTILNRVLEYRLKNKIVDKGITDSVALSILHTNKKEDKHISIKWFALLTGLGIGFIVINYSLPLGFHSLAAMSLSIAAGFLGYFFYQKLSGK